jgi:hypothetical protein
MSATRAVREADHVEFTDVPSNMQAPRTLPLSDEVAARDEKLKRLAHLLGRQAARRQMFRGCSILEIAGLLALCALVIGALLMSGYLPPSLFHGHR